MKTITALSIRQPWASAILLGKDVENRSRRFHHRGPLLIHATARPDMEAWQDPRILSLGLSRNELRELPLGKLIGLVNIVDCVREHPSRWAEPDSWKLVIEPLTVWTFPPVPYRGQLSPFQVPIKLLVDRLPQELLREAQGQLQL